MRTSLLAGICSASIAASTAASAQAPAPAYGAPAPAYGAPAPAYGTPQGGWANYGGQPPPSAKSTANEIGYLYATAGAYGLGTGIWLDSELSIGDPGLRLVLPALGAVAGPAAVYLLDSPPMAAGLPSAIATGMVIGAGEGLGIASYQHVSSKAADQWGFQGLARSEVLGSTLGGAAGYAAYTLGRPSPRTNVLLASSMVWGSLLGSEFGAGASKGSWGESNDKVSLGGLIGFNAAVVGAGAASMFWTPSWDQITWMWGGLGLGTLVSLPVYIFYVGSDYSARRGLIFQGVAGALGLAAGAMIGSPDGGHYLAADASEQLGRRRLGRILGGGLMPLDHGFGATMTGQLW
jgi:hypothetical protein